MALGDYILCCKCEVKLIYDGDRGQREWWEERFGKPPEIECPDCKTQRTWVGLTDEELRELEKKFNAERVRTSDEEYLIIYPSDYYAWQRAIEARLKEKNT